MMKHKLLPLAELLNRRLAIIGDCHLREADPQAHLAALRAVSEAIETERARLTPELPARLRHFLDQASYHKALAFINELEP